jgi:hydrogenase nickel incorporation protein HypA/HybF
MHESTMTRELVRKIIAIATQNEAAKVTGVRLVVGPLAGLSEGHLREHFKHDACGTIVEGADLQISMGNARLGPLSAEVLLESIEIS